MYKGFKPPYTTTNRIAAGLTEIEAARGLLYLAVASYDCEL